MNRKLLIAIGLTFCLSLAACGGTGEVSSTEPETTVSVDENTTSSDGGTSVVTPEEREDEFSVSEDLLSVTLGKYEQDNNTSNGTEPIEWIVLDKQDNRALVISKNILDCQPFNSGFKACTWESSSVRKWLNADFLNLAFSVGEQEKIITSFVPKSDPDLQETLQTSETSDEGNTDNAVEVLEASEPEGCEDKIFLLSDFEVSKYLSDDANVEGDEAYCKPSEYARALGVWTLTEDIYSAKGYKEKGYSENCIGAGWWWLRTTNEKETKAIDIDTTGKIRENGHDVGECHDGIRPAMWITLE